ncbi:probable G-protein coupled receptor Mth-like 4 isoform X2 [Galleria mellonella]|uniref:Probable G-protein coupled receptor Mth-like 4 isoform X2 n=1 Tax=Galleria mellonella TaxID=7137 RepID=A0A6J1WX53_GALME|nr:probable G-protein coupled receptor Mth-like 4 isoform X2 [Galleria mellonella]
MKEKIIIISLVVGYFLPSMTSGYNNNCCDTGQQLKKIISEDGFTVNILCLDLATNNTTPLSITCKTPVAILATFYINDEGHLVVQTSVNHDIIIKSGEDLLGKSLISFCGSLSIGLSILVIMKLMAYSNMSLCAVRGFFAYFFILSSFFWSNAMAIQIMFSMRRPCLLYDRGWREFSWYSLYAWGCPAVLTIITAIVNFHPGDHPKPGIGLMHCWFVGNQQWYYMYSVMTILILANIGIFIWTSTRFWCLSFNSSHVKAVKYKLMLTIRLFVLMGIPWIFEMIGSLVETSIVWAIIDIINTLQGLFIFVLLVLLRRRAIKMMLKHGWLNCVSDSIEKYLALAEDEEDVVEHTIDVRMDGNITT